MAFVVKRGRAYEYRSIRRGGKVTSEYVAGGGISAESAAFFRELEAGRKALRCLDRADWEAQRGRMDRAEREVVQADAAYDQLATAALLATGHHRPRRGPWRRRRRMTTTAANPSRPAPMGRAEMTELLDGLDRSGGDERKALQARAQEGVGVLLDLAKRGDEGALPALRVFLARRPGYLGKLGIGDFASKAMAVSAAGAKDVLLRDLFIREIEAMRDDLAGPDPTPLERLLCERVALTWFDANQRDIAEVEAGGGISPDKSEYLSRQKSRATARFLAAAKALATVRRLAVPVLRVGAIVGQAGQVNAMVGGGRAAEPREDGSASPG